MFTNRAWSRVPLVVLGSIAIGCGSGDDGAEPDPAPADEIVSRPPAEAPPADPASPAPPAADPPPAELHVTALANLGDSISQGFDADDSEPLDLNLATSKPSSVFKDAPTLSWVQGSDARVKSVAAHYRALDPKLVVTPFSHSGAEMTTTGAQPNFQDQAKALVAAGAKPDLVYVLLGGNDVCHRPKSTTADGAATLYTVDQWRAGVARGLDVLAASLPAGATVRMVSMPRVDLLYDIAKDRAVRVRATIDTPAGPVSGITTRYCHELWDITAAAGNGICKIVTTETSAARRAAIGRRIDAYNDATAEEVARIANDAARNPKHVVFQTEWHGSRASGAAEASSMGTYVFTSTEVSARDCFHPSIEGQNAIASFVLTRAKFTSEGGAAKP